MPKIAVVSFPGNNCEVESIRALQRVGIDAQFFRWNDDVQTLEGVDGYFIPGGFSYEDRGRAGMVAARDPLMQHIAEEAAKGKVVIGNCNGAQILVESGLIPLSNGLQMSLAKNAIADAAVGFINEWVWVKPTCAEDRCATSAWKAPIHMPMAHGEGRFTTKDKDLLQELEANGQLAFRYCNKDGDVSEEPMVTPNGSVYAVAGICNAAGNVVALMPHPERTVLGDPYFASVKTWIQQKGLTPFNISSNAKNAVSIDAAPIQEVEIFIQSIITNNEERTVEQALRRILPSVRLTQYTYYAPSSASAEQILLNIALFNPNKQKAFVRLNGKMHEWNADSKMCEPTNSTLLGGTAYLRIDQPDSTANAIGGGTTGICYVCTGVTNAELEQASCHEIFANPHASRLVSLT